MALAEMTIWGMYQYDQGLFDACPLPAGMSKKLLIDCIMDKSGQLYPYHQSIPMFKRNISGWFTRNREQFSKIWEALHINYAPLENYDKHSNITDHAESSGDGEGLVSAYNSNSYEPSNKSKTSGTADNLHTEYTHGNIGVTTSQDMLAQEQAVREYDIYEMIAHRFEKEFLIEVY